MAKKKKTKEPITKVTATERQKRTFDLIHKKNYAVSRAMKETGYAPSVAKNPQDLTKSKGYISLLQSYRDTLEKSGVTKEFRASTAKKLLDSKNESIKLNTLKHVDSIAIESETASNNATFNAPVQIIVRQIEEDTVVEGRVSKEIRDNDPDIK